jgi:hypothetical protein
MSIDWTADLIEAHRLLCPEQVGSEPGFPDGKIMALRVRLINEEHREFLDAVHNEDLADTVDALVDKIYVEIGTAVAMGVDLRPVWDAVHAANLAKAGGPRRADGKFLKSESWVHPNIKEIIENQGPLQENTRG